MKRAWLIPQALLAAAIFVAVILDWLNPSLPVVAFEIDLGSLLVVIGFLLATIIALALLVQERTIRRYDSVQDAATAERRSFLRRLDHELKNPITAIFMGLANLKTGARTKQESEYLQIIETHTRRLQRLTADLRKLADLEQMKIDMIEVPLADLLKETFTYVQDSHPAESREYSLVLPDVPWPLPSVRGDYDLLQLAFHNLLENSIKFTDQGDSVELRASEDGNHIVIEIADSGPGIPEDEIPLVWQELYRGAGAQGIPGSGLGLALTQAIIERHEGSITLRSRQAEGTVVTTRLPAA